MTPTRRAALADLPLSGGGEEESQQKTRPPGPRFRFQDCASGALGPSQSPIHGLSRDGSVQGPGSAVGRMKVVLSMTLEARVVRQPGIVVVATLAREGLGARIEVRALLHDDAGAGPAVLVAADEDGVPTVDDDPLLSSARRPPAGPEGPQLRRERWRRRRFSGACSVLCPVRTLRARFTGPMHCSGLRFAATGPNHGQLSLTQIKRNSCKQKDPALAGGAQGRRCGSLPLYLP